MDITLLEILGIILILSVASLAQGVLGFGFGLITIPAILYILGWTLQETVVFFGITASFNLLAGLYKLRASIPWTELGLPLAFRIVGTITGVKILGHIAGLDRSLISQIAAAGIAVGIFVEIYRITRKRDDCHTENKVPLRITTATFLFSGLMFGTIGIGGPPMILWTLRRNWQDTKKNRAFLLAIGVLPLIIQQSMLCYEHTEHFCSAASTAVIFAPLVFVVSAASTHYGNRVPKERLRTATLAMLCLMVLMMFFKN